MTDSNAPELLPCPFCGGEAEAISLFPSGGRTFVKCKFCRASGPAGGRDWAITAWNTRPAITPQQAAKVPDSVMAQRLRDKLHGMGHTVPADVIHHALRAIALDTITATCDNTREGE